MGWIFWDKGQELTMSDGELAYTSFERALRKKVINRCKIGEHGGLLHPTQKPVKLYEWLLTNYAKPNDLILDTHCGSASSLIACENFSTTDALTENDYPELNSVLPAIWKPIEVALGFVGDSALLEFEIKPIELGVTVKLNNILFDTNSDQLDASSLIVLNSFIDFLKDNPTVEIALHGHTDDVGNADANLDLSNRRAKSVEKYLAENGIDKSRMTSKGFGETVAIAPNDTEEGRALNRRTEFVIVGL